MSEAQKMWDQALQAQEKVFGNRSIVYQGIIRPCLYGALRRLNELEEGGKSGVMFRTVTIRKSSICTVTADSTDGITADSDKATDNLNTAPHPGRLCIAENRKMRILEVSEDQLGVAWVCKLIDPNR